VRVLADGDFLAACTVLAVTIVDANKNNKTTGKINFFIFKPLYMNLVPILVFIEKGFLCFF
jgi:hypothetical protein